MNRLKHLSISLIAIVAVGALSASAASAETVSSSTEITPRGTLSKTERRPVDVHMEAKVMPDAGATKLRELVNTRLNLPKDLTFSTKGTQVCRKDIGQNNPENANRSIEAIVAECPNSVVGGGTAVINVAGLVASPVTDPILTVFNGGEDKDGNPILLIHGFSATVLPGGHGVPMKGVLRNGTLDVSIPTLAANSAVSEFTFDLPGKVGKDPKYSLAKCSTGKWVSNAVLTLGTYNNATGQYATQNFTTPQQTQDCVGVNTGGGAKAAITKPKVMGSKQAKRGGSKTYKVVVKNYGKRAVKGVKIVTRGKGVKAGKKTIRLIKPGKAARTKVRMTFRKKGKIKVKVTANAKGVKSKTSVIRVRVK